MVAGAESVPVQPLGLRSLGEMFGADTARAPCAVELPPPPKVSRSRCSSDARAPRRRHARRQPPATATALNSPILQKRPSSLECPSAFAQERKKAKAQAQEPAGKGKQSQLTLASITSVGYNLSYLIADHRGVSSLLYRFAYSDSSARRDRPRLSFAICRNIRNTPHMLCV